MPFFAIFEENTIFKVGKSRGIKNRTSRFANFWFGISFKSPFDGMFKNQFLVKVRKSQGSNFLHNRFANFFETEKPFQSSFLTIYCQNHRVAF